LLEAAIARLAEVSALEGASSLYGSRAWGVVDQPDFVNAVVRIRDPRHPQDLLALLHQVEDEFGRLRTRRWGPRSLDLDLLTYGDWSYDGWELRVPHPGLYLRAFVLLPLLELEPDFQHPETGESARAALARLSSEDREGTWKLG
jgi:2-amino-4-hydroxy-6-hydroxymethyldihydropteridine diphosphokinase